MAERSPFALPWLLQPVLRRQAQHAATNRDCNEWFMRTKVGNLDESRNFGLPYNHRKTPGDALHHGLNDNGGGPGGLRRQMHRVWRLSMPFSMQQQLPRHRINVDEHLSHSGGSDVERTA